MKINNCGILPLLFLNMRRERLRVQRDHADWIHPAQDAEARLAPGAVCADGGTALHGQL